MIPWLPYDESQLKQFVSDGRPVFIDFTASWCSTCQVNSLIAIETEDVAKALNEHNFVPMLADWSKPNPAIAKKIQELNSNSIPLLAIYPAGLGSEPLVLRDTLTQGMVLDAIKKAVSVQKSVAADTDKGKPGSSADVQPVSIPPKSVKKNVSDKSVQDKPVLQSVTKEVGVR